MARAPSSSQLASLTLKLQTDLNAQTELALTMPLSPKPGVTSSGQLYLPVTVKETEAGVGLGQGGHT